MSRTILTVDDSASVRQMVAFTLQRAGYAVVEADDGQQALSCLDGQSVQMVITDLNMPNLDGLELIRCLRAMEPYRYIPIIMLTTESQDEKKQAGRAAGASGWIVKPFRAEQLVAVVKRFLP